MIYLDADNSLEEECMELFNSLEEAIDPSLVNVIVLFDRIEGYDSSNGDWTETRLYQILPDSRNNIINSNLLENWGEMKMDQPETLTRFIKYCLANYTADRYILDICDHGAGILGICWDDTSGDDLELSVGEARSAIEQAISGYIDKIDVIHFQACNMAMFELVYDFRNLADYLVVSQEMSYAPKKYYRSILKELVSNPSISSLDFAKSFVDLYEKIMHTSSNKYKYDTTLSVIDATNTEIILQKFNNFVNNLTTVVDEGNHQEIFKIRFQTQDFYYHSFADLVHLLENVVRSNLFNNFYPDLIVSANNLLLEIDNLIVYNYQDVHFSQNANGLSIFLPHPDYFKWSNYLENYRTHSDIFFNMNWLFNTDYEELIYLLYTQDTDGDHLFDWFEKMYGLNPFYRDSDFDETLDYLEDSDHDGNWNFIELMQGTNPLLIDTDNDGISDRDENSIYMPKNEGANKDGYVRTSPYDFDSDRDGWNDYKEIFQYNTNPNDHKSQPDFRRWSFNVPIFGGLIIFYIIIVKSDEKDEDESDKNHDNKIDYFLIKPDLFL